jgi:hypothetical protein
VGRLIGYFGGATIVFVAFAAIRNAIRAPGVEEDDSTREWTNADKEEFKRLMDGQR